ncbi:MAG: hypothetical protein OER97_08530 [Gammaproteobacteria bacterium]|nr:hypothetical protein [Gammaproteobacteria bacterium]
MSVTRLKFLLLVLGVVLSATLHAADNIQSDLRRCGAMADDAARLKCFDALTAGIDNAGDNIDAAQSLDTVQSPPSVEQEVVDVAAVDQDVKPTVVPLDDSVGKDQVETATRADGPTYVARLTRCEETGPSSLTVFYLDNGQAWKQRNSGRLRMRDCDADIEIRKDWFGFKLYIPSQKRTIRVSRIN